MDDKKVGYALSFMTKGTVKSWAAIHTQNALDASSFGTFQDFITDFQSPSLAPTPLQKPLPGSPIPK